ncbi:hypothetical protein GN244_ATG03792 [Phytophthora infestans]|uniref:Uncharacterized protein n=1 Tax=Phytophthora infestans TaxID=4787 RepID=A0A833TIC9_PHYIN|nr:hypothetical protein GN244_ATG03792 [Phytophthora infestans]KAF4134094.1 hypothetical protein GN958_ATG16776 [Phytophthora infestans]
MAMTDTLVARLKADLKRSLRKHVGDAVNDVCNAFIDELKPAYHPPSVPLSTPVGALRNEVDYDCCRQLVKYIVRNMDTSPEFAQQMDCVILAYQSNASVDILNSVVSQNMWVRRKFVQTSGGEQEPLKPPRAAIDSHKGLEDKSLKSTVDRNGVSESSASSLASGKVMSTFRGDSTKVNPVKRRKGALANAQIGEPCRAKHTAALKDSTQAVKAKTPTHQRGFPTMPTAHQKTTPVKRLSAHVGSSEGVDDSINKRSVSRASLPVACKPARAQADTAETCPHSSSILEGRASISDTSASSNSHTRNSTTSRPREWGKRKRLVTRKRPKVAAMPSKRAGRAPWKQSFECSDQSSTESDNSEKPVRTLGQADHVIVISGAEKKSGNTVTMLSKNATANDGLVIAEKTMKNAMGAATSSIGLQLRQVERDLEAGDEVWGMNVAKAKFQAMLDVIVAEDSQSTILSETETDENSQVLSEDPFADLCDPTQRSVDQSRLFQARLRDTITIVDATLCNPPQGHLCSQDCKDIRAQLCNQFTPCINPTCRAWHEAEAHIESCPREQCELKNRVRLRETMHLIERKQQQVTAARAAFEHANEAHVSPARLSNKKRTNVGNAKALARIETLEQDIENLTGELMILIDMKLQLSITLSDIDIDIASDDRDRFPEFASHYAARSHRRKYS